MFGLAGAEVRPKAWRAHPPPAKAQTTLTTRNGRTRLLEVLLRLAVVPVVLLLDVPLRQLPHQLLPHEPAHKDVGRVPPVLVSGLELNFGGWVGRKKRCSQHAHRRRTLICTYTESLFSHARTRSAARPAAQRRPSSEMRAVPPPSSSIGRSVNRSRVRPVRRRLCMAAATGVARR